MTGLVADITVRRGEGPIIDVSLEVSPGSTAALLGPNGAGKTTVIEAVAGLVAIDAGSVELGGRTLDDPRRGVFVPPEERRVGVVHQDGLLFPHLDVLGNVSFPLRSLRHPEWRRLALRSLQRLGVDGLAARTPATLSGGEAQMVALARTLASDPRLLLLDEPLAALDAGARLRVRRVLADEFASFPGPRVLITHDPAEAFLLADHIHVMEGGRIVQSGDADDIRLRPRTEYVADLAGANLVRADASGHRLTTAAGHVLHVAGTHHGAVLATIQPQAVTLHAAAPAGSARNTWQTAVRRVEPIGDRVRVQTGDPLPLTVEVTPAAVVEMAIAPGNNIWASLKATEIAVDEA